MNFDNSSIMWSTGKAAPMAFSSDIYTIEISFYISIKLHILSSFSVQLWLALPTRSRNITSFFIKIIIRVACVQSLSFYWIKR